MASRCTGTKPLADLPLPILEEQRSAIRKSKSGKWRAIVLLLVHVLLAAHIGHWMATGESLSPLEPSEAMRFSQQSIVNAGLIFFVLTIGSTIVLGRWFCGWACHVVALQDGSRWLLAKMGIRPRMVNLGILGTVPWIAFTYMFLAPLAQRLLHGQDVSVRGTELTTQAFWETFPGWPVALVTFFVCGFVAVYLLGSKGFCNYGCPYAGIFGLADQLAPMRIRVTDACDGCGHCTAVCTSNVQVHQEVRDYGAVVDPGCMKHLDCVSVCPKDALYVGFGMPAIAAKPRAPLKAVPGDSLAGTLLDFGLMAAFFTASFALMLDFDEDLSRIPGVQNLLVVLVALSLAVTVVFRGKARRKREYARAEEVLLAAGFLLTMYAFRGYKDWVPLLFALGLSTILAYVVVQMLRVAYRSDVKIQRHVLLSAGKWRSAGTVFAVSLLPIGALGAYAGWSRHELRSSYEDGIREAQAGRFEPAIEHLRRAVELEPRYKDAQSKLASLLCDVGRLDEGIAEYESVLARAPHAVEPRALLGLALFRKGDLARARAELERAVAEAPLHPDLRGMLAEVCAGLGDLEAARRHGEEAQRLRATPPPSPH
ncbi:MAG: tetratricopeptide repeat protein [Planctomycetota bacterium]